MLAAESRRTPDADEATAAVDTYVKALAKLGRGDRIQTNRPNGTRQHQRLARKALDHIRVAQDEIEDLTTWWATTRNLPTRGPEGTVGPADTGEGEPQFRSWVNENFICSEAVKTAILAAVETIDREIGWILHRDRSSRGGGGARAAPATELLSRVLITGRRHGSTAGDVHRQPGMTSPRI